MIHQHMIYLEAGVMLALDTMIHKPASARQFKMGSSEDGRFAIGA
jgi:hypothetical protein